MEIKTWADFGALPKEELDTYSPEEIETMKVSIAENEAKLAEDFKKKEEEYAKAKELAENYKIRAEKAEKAEKTKKEGKEEMESKDIYALVKADVPEEDVDEVRAFATYKKMSVAEALKDKTLKSILSDRAEERRTANLSQVKGARVSSKITGEALIEKIQKGEEVKIEDIDKLVEARMKAKMGNKN